MHIDCTDRCAEEHQELHVGVRLVPRIEQVDAGVGRQRPVDVLAGAIDLGEWLLVKEALEAVSARGLPEHLHREHLVVHRHVRVLEGGRDLVLARRDLVVARLDGDAQLEETPLGVRHEREHPVGDGPEVVVLELLALGRRRAHHRSPAHRQVKPLLEELAVDEEVLLLAPERGEHS